MSEKCAITGTRIGSDDWLTEPACQCVPCNLAMDRGDIEMSSASPAPAPAREDKVERLEEENMTLVSHIYFLLDAGKLARWPDDVSEANWGVSALAARKAIESSTAAKSVEYSITPRKEQP